MQEVVIASVQEPLDHVKIWPLHLYMISQFLLHLRDVGSSVQHLTWETDVLQTQDFFSPPQQGTNHLLYPPHPCAVLGELIIIQDLLQKTLCVYSISNPHNVFQGSP